MKILILRIGRLGDIVMTLPATQALIKKYPSAKIDIITSHDGLRVFKNYHPSIENLFPYRGTFPRRLLDFYRVKRAIANERYDLVYCFEKKPRHLRLLPKIGTPLILQPENKKIHYANHCLNLVDENNLNDYPREAYLKSSEKGAVLLAQQLKDYNIEADDLLIGLHPTFSGSLKLSNSEKSHRSWPRDHFIRLAKILASLAKAHNRKLRIVIDLLPKEKKIGEDIERDAGGLITLMTPTPNFQRYIAYLNRLNVLISPNTGAMHLAAALNTPTVALFSGFQPEDCGPYMNPDNCKVLRAEDSENPSLGLASITPEAVANAAWELLKAQGDKK